MKRYLFLTLAVLLCTLSASAYDFMVDGIAYCKNDDGKSVSVVSGSYYTGNIAIPENVTYGGRSYFVTSIRSSAFYYCSGLTSVTIPNSVTKIGRFTFGGTPWLSKWYDNQPDGIVYIGKVACGFKGKMPSSTAIAIKEGTVSISDGAFASCSGLASVTIPISVTEIGESAFCYCDGLTSVTIGNSVTKIGWRAFDSCTGLTSVTIPNSVTEIGGAVFFLCI